MRKPLAVALAISIALVGCKQKVAETDTPASPATPATTETPAAANATGEPAKLPRFATAARIAEIKASGRTGFWIDTPEFCPGHRVGVL